MDLAIASKAVQMARIFVERISNDLGENNEIEKIYSWQRFVSERLAKRDIKDFGIPRKDHNIYIKHRIEIGNQRINEMADANHIAVYRCLADAECIGESILYSTFDQIWQQQQGISKDMTVIFRQGAKIVRAMAMDVPAL